jgi:hypothetical protein
MIKRLTVSAALLLLSSCGNEEATPAGVVTQSEAQALNDAAAMLDESDAAVRSATNSN